MIGPRSDGAKRIGCRAPKLWTYTISIAPWPSWANRSKTSPALAILKTPRCTKDWIEEELFEQRRDLFSEIDLVFFDTTSIYFEGEGGQEIGQYGKSKDHRPGSQADGGGVGAGSARLAVVL